ncbi:DDE-type integrase/transposase/recombinase [Mycolicibacterium chubuense]|uniref:DDE-type integrase/transposase/recombinase n=1 Tax=Mycolicibacterium chubuense TaxID=1800 RepID=UPI001300DB1C|nr:DDE-type integrase/transposase/recombinase [Mycolicibacterium chubuense]
MSKARLVITAVLVEGRSQSQVARDYAVSQGWISRLIKQYTLEGDAAFQPRSRRPRTSPRRLPQDTIDLIVELRYTLSSKGPTPDPTPSPGTCTTTTDCTSPGPRSAATSTPPAWSNPAPKNARSRPTSASPPHNAGERWQADFTHWRLAGGTDIEILCWLDDCSRLALSVTAHRRVTGPLVVEQFTKAIAQHAIPYSTLTDNGMVFTTRLAGGKVGRNGFEAELHRHGIHQINSPQPPHHLRKSRTLPPSPQKWLTSQPRANTLAALQTQLNAFAAEYNHRRPHRSLLHRATPAVIYTSRPKADPATRIDTHNRVRADRVDQAGAGHPARQRTSSPHRHRTPPPPNPRPNPRPGP